MVAKLSIVIALIITAIFLPSLSLQFTNWDDDKFVTNNEDIRRLDFPHLKKIFSSTYEGGYTPITQLSFALNYALGGLNAVYYHATNILLHIANSILVVYILTLLRINLLTAGVIALIWAIHPMRVESVSWVSERKDVLFLFFYLLVGVLYLHHRYKSAMSVFILACLAKHQAALLALILPFHQWRVNWVFYCIATVVVVLNVSTVKVSWTNQEAYSLIEKFFLMNFAAFIYALKTFIPFQLCVLYPYPEKVNGFFPWYVYASSIFVGMCLWLTFICREYHRFIGYAIFFFAINILLPLANIIAGGYLLNDRYTYVASIGLMVAVGLVIEYFYLRQSQIWIKRLILVGVLIYACIMGWMTFHRQAIWKDGVSLWSDVIKQYPQQARFYDNRGTAYLQAGNDELALQDFNKAIQLDPTFPGAYSNRAVLLSKQGEKEGVLADYNKAIELNENYGIAYYNRALFLYHQGLMIEAFHDLDKARQQGVEVPSDFYGYVKYRVGLEGKK